LDELNSACPRCGGAFRCGVKDEVCACSDLVLSDELQAHLRERYTGCLCLGCLRRLAETGLAGEPGWSRRRFSEPADQASEAWAPRLLDLLLTQDGSATRICERLSGGTVRLVVHAQSLTTEVPAIVRSQLPGSQFVERFVSLVRPAGGRTEVMMDNLSYIALADLPDDVAEDLLSGREPIGHLLERIWLKRRELPDVPTVAEAGVPGYDIATWNIILGPPGMPAPVQEALNRALVASLAEPALQQRLWQQFGLADPEATRSYRIDTPDGPAMLITECFRFGMRSG
jgi:chorismate-pyruvate lyase